MASKTWIRVTPLTSFFFFLADTPSLKVGHISSRFNHIFARLTRHRHKRYGLEIITNFLDRVDDFFNNFIKVSIVVFSCIHFVNDTKSYKMKPIFSALSLIVIYKHLQVNFDQL